MKNSKFKKTLIIILVIIVSYPIITTILAGNIYNSIFSVRYQTQMPLDFKIEEFDNLKREKHIYQSINNDDIVGYLYFNDMILENDCHGLIVVVHGLGSGGHSIYMETINYFVNNSFLVFSYDASGNNESGGKIYGLPQQLIDLKTTIEYIEKIDSLQNLPLFLFGHSWGGYAVCNILNYIDGVSAVVSASGFNSTYDLISSYSLKYAGVIAYTGLPFVFFHESNKFGDFSSSSALNAFDNSTANVMIIHSEDDEVVPIKIGYDLYYEKYYDNKRFKFLKYKNRGHSFVIYSEESINTINEFNKGFDKWLLSLDYDYSKKRNQDRFLKDKEKYYKDNLDRNIICNLIDKQLFSEIVEFYIQSI